MTSDRIAPAPLFGNAVWFLEKLETAVGVVLSARAHWVCKVGGGIRLRVEVVGGAIYVNLQLLMVTGTISSVLWGLYMHFAGWTKVVL